MTQQAINTEPVVFVVDDDIDVRDGMKSLMRPVGLRCEVFPSPRKFLSANLPTRRVVWCSMCAYLERAGSTFRPNLPALMPIFRLFSLRVMATFP